jgi:hypothetical protein
MAINRLSEMGRELNGAHPYRESVYFDSQRTSAGRIGPKLDATGRLSQMCEALTEEIQRRPGVCLAIGLCIGVFVGCLIKRR